MFKKSQKNSILAVFILFSFVLLIEACNSDCAETDITVIPQPQPLHITMDEAEQNLNQIIMRMKLRNTRAAQNRDFTITSRYTTAQGVTRAAGDSGPEIYVFNFGENEGYAVMSSYIREPDIYALSFSGKLNPDSVIDEPDTRIFMAALRTRLDSLYNRPNAFGDDEGGFIDPGACFVVYTPWVTTDIVYEDGSTELCKVKWGQGSPYNGMLATNSDGYHIPTGCTATAVGQLMSVYKYPDSYASFNIDWDDVVSYVRMDDNTPFWPLYSVQSLMLYLGMYNNLDLHYNAETNGNSCSNINNVTRTLNNFGYSNPGTVADYNTSTVVSELRNGYPVLISGTDNTPHGGHMWLAHGLQIKHRQKQIWSAIRMKLIQTINENQYWILCNMGYNGSISDKHYLSGVFDTRTQDEIDMNSNDGNYRYNLKCISGIRN